MNRHLIITCCLLMAAITYADSSVSVTVYNDNLALVRDVRELNYEAGAGEILFKEVSGRIDATSVHFSADGVEMLEQNFDYDLVSPEKLVEKYIDSEINVVTKEGDLASGVLLTASGGQIVLQQKDASLRSLQTESIVEVRYPELPDGLITRPTLRWLVNANRAGAKQTEVSYLTSNLSWRADYVLVLQEENDSRANLSAWVTINNTCGASFMNAKLKLMAGEIHRAQDQNRYRHVAKEYLMADAAAPGGFEEKSFFEYHLYTLQRPTDLLDRQTKQVSLFPNAFVDTKRIYEYDWQRSHDRVGVSVEFENTEDNGLGIAIPAGRVRVYQQDTDGGEEFVGEDNIQHIPRDEKIRVRVGEAFDIVAERVQKDRRRITDRVWEQDFEVKLRNRKDEAVNLVVLDYFYGDWTIISSSHEHNKVSASKLEFNLRLVPDQELVLTYTIRNQ